MITMPSMIKEDGSIYIKSDRALGLNEHVNVINLKGEAVIRKIESLQTEFRGEYFYNFSNPASTVAHKAFSYSAHAGDRCVECGRVTGRYGRCSCGGM